MTFATTPFLLVSTYSSTGVPSAVLPKSFFSTPARMGSPPSARGAAIQSTGNSTAAHAVVVRMVRLLVANAPFPLPARDGPCKRLLAAERISRTGLLPRRLAEHHAERLRHGHRRHLAVR